MDILGEYNEFVRKLEAAGIEYATCGGLAMAVHGYVRATKDLDFLIRSEDLGKAFEVARSLGFDIEGLPLEFDGGSFQLRRISKINTETKSLITVDFILVTEKIEDVWEDREHLDWDSGSAWVVSRRGLIKMKRPLVATKTYSTLKSWRNHAMKVDMSPKAIERRLNDLNQIWRLCVTLGNARRTPSSKMKPQPRRENSRR